jgi:hypothetical protein
MYTIATNSYPKSTRRSDNIGIALYYKHKLRFQIKSLHMQCLSQGRLYTRLGIAKGFNSLSSEEQHYAHHMARFVTHEFLGEAKLNTPEFQCMAWR